MIKKFVGGPYLTNGYVFYDSRDAAIVDVPQDQAIKMNAFLDENNLNLRCILLTHVHWDHTQDVMKLKELTSTSVLMHNFDYFNQAEINSIFGGDAGIVQQDGQLAEGDVIKIGHAALVVMHTPGHTPGSVCLYEKKHGVLFSGDTLFAGTHGRVDFPLSSTEDMKESLKRLLALPKDTEVMTGHGMRTTISKEDWIEKL